ncbi:MAG: PAS domain S-box protein [Chitinispirillaceae bacterium]|nr:PAS domain S-box protein [Chitinispirillaceae bacterium]
MSPGTKGHPERKRSEESIRLNEEKYRALFDQSFLGIYLHALDGRVVDVNQMACVQSGYSKDELLQRTVFDNFPANPDSSNRQKAEIMREWNRWQPGQRFIISAEHQRKNGTVYPVEISTGLVSYGVEKLLLAIVQDITDRKKVEENLINMQKLESLGVLAGGIAHDFNNLLGGIFGYIGLANEVSHEQEVSTYCMKALESINRARGLTQQLLTFAKGGKPVKKIERLTPFIQDTVRFALSGSTLTCNFKIQEDLWMSCFDRNQIGQVIDNIIINAKQAMPDGGTVTVSAENVTIKDQSLTTLSPGNYVNISIKDQGIGMPGAILPRIFDPFYTTKPRGHGLGLATCYSIVNHHGGRIDVESEPGKGSTFHVYLPARPDAVPETVADATHSYKGSGTMLIMDDDDIIRETIENMLKILGHSVMPTKNGSEALEVFAVEARSNRMLAGMILDLTIPGGKGGKEVIEEVRKIDKIIPVFVASGYADDPVMANPAEYGFTASISKPFTLADLSAMIGRHVASSR